MTISTPSGWGSPFAENPEPSGASLPLVTLCEVLQHRLALAPLTPLKPTIERLRQQIRRHAGLRLYALRPGDHAEPVTDATVWPAIYPPPVRRTLSGGLSRRTPIPYEASPVWPEHRGVIGVLERLRLWLPNACEGQIAEQMGQDPSLRTAMLKSDAIELFGYGEQLSTAPATNPAPVVALRLVDPATKSTSDTSTLSAPADKSSMWKDSQGEWTDDAKKEMRRARDDGLTDKEIAQRFCVSRPNISRLIGSKIASKAKATVRRHTGTS